MSPARTRAYGLATPSPTQPWLGAMLRVFVELMRHAVSVFGMRPVGLSGECHTDAIHGALPQRKGDTLKETTGRKDNRHLSALMVVSSTQSVRPSNHEGGLTNFATPTMSFSGLSRESWFEQRGNSCQFRSRTNKDARHKAEHDAYGRGYHSSRVGIVIPETPKALSGTYSSTVELFVPWIPALRFAAAGMTAVHAAGVRNTLTA